MTLHPISIVDRVIDEYQNYLLTEFRARDPKLRAALEEALLLPRFLAQEPFFQAHRPFKPGKVWNGLNLDAKLADVMKKRADGNPAYLHQSQSIEYLLADDAKALVVTTGTGSGKTECFLIPPNHLKHVVDFILYLKSQLHASFFCCFMFNYKNIYLIFSQKSQIKNFDCC